VAAELTAGESRVAYTTRYRRVGCYLFVLMPLWRRRVQKHAAITFPACLQQQQNMPSVEGHIIFSSAH